MKNKLKKKIAFMLSILAISSSLAVTASAIQLGGGVSSGSYHGYLYADVPYSGYVASETTSDSNATRLDSNVYTTAYSAPRSIKTGNYASVTNRSSSGYSKVSVSNYTHVSGWYRAYSSTNVVSFETIKHYKAGNHSVITERECSLCGKSLDDLRP